MGQERSLTPEKLFEMSGQELANVMAGGHPIDPRELDDSEYRGVSLNLPKIFDTLLWQTFMKTFHRDPSTGALRGWNVRLEQTGLNGPCIPKTKRGQPFTFGHYRVLEAKGRRMPRPWDQALYLEYNTAGNTLSDPARWAGCPLVAVNLGNADLLLCWDFLQLGPLQIPTPSYWSLERVGRLSHQASPPRPADRP